MNVLPEKKINNSQSVKEILSKYLQLNFIVLDDADIDKDKIVASIDTYLNSMEENRLFASGKVKNTCFRCRTLPAIVKKHFPEKINNKENEDVRHLCPLCYVKYFCHEIKDIQAKVGEGDKFAYPPILKIAAIELISKIDPKAIDTCPDKKETKDKEDLDFKDIECALNVAGYDKKIIKPYHKYFAVLQADGDNLGRVSADIASPTELSKRLFDFAERSADIIKAYNGHAIFIGGDDILAFMPVAIKQGEGNTKTVIALARELSDEYDSIINTGVDSKNKSSLSVGLNIAYYKYPLSKTLANARDQLFRDAKSCAGKNTLAVCLTKHSGFQSFFRFSLAKYKISELDLFEEILSRVISGEIEIPQSIHHKLALFKTVLADIDNMDALNNFFVNTFNESVHKSKFNAGLKMIEKFLRKCLIQGTQEDKLKLLDEALQKLRFIKFIGGQSQ